MAATLESVTLDSADHAAAVCLGCGCACDDIGLLVRAGRIVDARNACERGIAWFGDGSVPRGIRVGGRDVPFDEAVGAAAALLSDARWPLVYVAPDLSCQAQRLGVAIADRLHAAIDSVTSATSLASILAAQELGCASATLGEIRHRADLVVFWGVDPSATHPRFRTRYLPEGDALHLPAGRRRTIAAVDVDGWTGPSEADIRIRLEADHEVATLTWLTALAAARGLAADRPGGHVVPSAVERLDRVFASARYVAIVVDEDGTTGRDPGLARAIVALSHALNHAGRCAVVGLRSGGNRSGADAVMTAHTGFPVAVDFTRGVPRYRPFDGTAHARLARREVDVALIVGTVIGIPSPVVSLLAEPPGIVVGARATESPLAGSRVVIDAGLAGVHHAGTALRMDDVPLPLRPAVPGPPPVEDVLQAMHARLTTTSRAPLT